MSTRATLRADLRRDLRDEDATAYIWTDAVLNRHIQHAIDEVEQVAPAIGRLTRSAPGTRQLDLSGDLPAGALWVEAVEHPLDRDPAAFRPFREEPGRVVRLLGAAPPPAGEVLAVWYAARYVVDDATSDLPPSLEPIVLAGALAFACLDQAIDTIARITPGGAGHVAYRALGVTAQARFAAALRTIRLTRATPFWRVAW